MLDLVTSKVQPRTKPAQLGLRLTPHSTIALTSPPWIRSVVNRIDALLSLPQNWDGEESESLDFECAMEVINFLLSMAAHETPAPQLIPTSERGVQVEWHIGGIDLEVKFGPHGNATYYYCSHDIEREGEVAGDEILVASLIGTLPPRNERSLSAR